jgi:2-succinyl-6-hydroxy-2,4-cyclohexadiene-1-carboxylate synthase
MRIALESLKGHSLNVERSGSGPNTIIAIHGFTGNAAIFDSFAAAAGNDYTVIRPELQGHGKSDAPDDPKLYDMKHTLLALTEIADRMEVKQAHWLGYSLGGRIALAAAVSLPERAISLTVESSSAGIDNIKERKARKESDDALADKIEKESLDEFVDYWESQPIFGPLNRLPLEIKKGLRQQRLQNNAKGLANSLRGIGAGIQAPLYKKLSGVKFPCLFIAGEEDSKYSAIAKRMHNSVSLGNIFLAYQSGHAVHLEQPEVFNRAVMRFLKMAETLRGISPTQPGSQPSQ